MELNIENLEKSVQAMHAERAILGIKAPENRHLYRLVTVKLPPGMTAKDYKCKYLKGFGAIEVISSVP